LDNYEFKLSNEEIINRISRGEYKEAAEIADTIDWSKVKTTRTLCRISDLYKINKRYEDARRVLLQAYERTPRNRKIIFSLCELDLKLNNYVNALQMYNEFIRIAPEDSDRYVLQYKIIKAQHTGLQDQIGALEELARHDYREKWALELAKLYRKAGEDYLCVQECEEIVAFFGDGPYVIKALEMKAAITELNPEEIERLAFLKAGGSYEPAFEESAPDQADDVSSPPAAETATAEADEAMSAEPAPAEAAEADEDMMAEPASAETAEETVEADEAMAAEPVSAETAEADEPAEADEAMSAEPASAGSAEADETPEAEPAAEETVEAGEAMSAEPAEAETAEVNAEPEAPAGAETPAAPVSDDTAPYTTRLGGGRVNITNYTDAGEEAGGTTNIIPDLSRFQKKTDRAPIRVKAEEETDQVFDDTVPVSTGRDSSTPAFGFRKDGQMIRPEGETRQEIPGSPVTEDISAEWAQHPGTGTGSDWTTRSRLDENVTLGQLADLAAAGGTADIETGTMTEAEIRKVLDNNTVRTSPIKQPLEPFSKKYAESASDWKVVTPSAKTGTAPEPPAAPAIPDEDIRVAPLDQSIVSEESLQETVARGMRDLENYGAVRQEDGDDSYVITPEEEKEKKRPSTGQLDLQGIMSEWEKVRQDNETSDPEAFHRVKTKTDAPEDEDETAAEQTEEVRDDADREADEDSDSTSSTRPWNPDEVREAMRRRKAREALSREDEELSWHNPVRGSAEAGNTEEAVLGAMSLDGYTGNVIITGEEGSGTLDTARNLIDRYKELNPDFDGKIAKTAGALIRAENLAKRIPKLERGALIIEHASGMSTEAVTALCTLLAEKDRHIIVFLVDKKPFMDTMLYEQRKLRRAFTARIDLAALSQDTLLSYAVEYAAGLEYSMDDSAIDALRERIEDIQIEEEHNVSLEEVREMVDEAIDYANRKSLSNLVGKLSGRRYGKDNMIILHDRDFLHY
jgi:tetratricopeptide (TPR) repeat protein